MAEGSGHHAGRPQRARRHPHERRRGENEININLTFDDAPPAQVPEEPETLLSGKYRPTTYAADDGEFPPPAPEGSRGTSLAVFNNSNPNGAWSLYVFDDSDTEDGSIAGWSLKITAQARVRVKPKPKRQR